MAYSKQQIEEDVTLMHDDALMYAIAYRIPYSLTPECIRRAASEAAANRNAKTCPCGITNPETPCPHQTH